LQAFQQGKVLQYRPLNGLLVFNDFLVVISGRQTAHLDRHVLGILIPQLFMFKIGDLLLIMLVLLLVTFSDFLV
jgi:hypothetical protein